LEGCARTGEHGLLRLSPKSLLMRIPFGDRRKALAADLEAGGEEYHKSRRGSKAYRPHDSVPMVETSPSG